MDVKAILHELDARLEKLQQARNILASLQHAPSTNIQVVTDNPPAKLGKRKLSPEGRQRIQEAVRRRWAKQKESKLDKYQPETDPLALRNF